MSSSRFTALTLEAPAVGEDSLVAGLWALGSAGSWSEPATAGRIRLHAFFPVDEVPLPEALAELLRSVGSVVLLGLAPAPERDWLAEWGAASGPIQVGDRFVVDPGEVATELDPSLAAGRFLLRLPARTAFGLGSHESTRLAVELLERAEPAGKRILDIGTGSGILAFAAALLGAARVEACDLDPAAALLAEQYRIANRIERVAVWVGTIAALAAADRAYDLALVNVVPAEIAPDLPRLAAVLVDGGRVLFSGILVEQLDAALAALARHGFEETGRRSAGEWAALATELRR